MKLLLLVCLNYPLKFEEFYVHFTHGMMTKVWVEKIVLMWRQIKLELSLIIRRESIMSLWWFHKFSRLQSQIWDMWVPKHRWRLSILKICWEKKWKCAKFHIQHNTQVHTSSQNLIFFSENEVEKWETQFLLYVSSRQAASIRCLWITTRVKKAYLHTWPSPIRPVSSFAWWGKFLFSWAASRSTYEEYAWIVCEVYGERRWDDVVVRMSHPPTYAM